MPANTYCDIAGVVRELERILLLYETAMKVDDYVHFCQDRNYYSAYMMTGRSGFAEAFLAMPAPEFTTLMSHSEA
jgi:hypothetical protein